MTDTTIADTTQEVTDATQEAVKQVNQLTQYVQDSIPELITFGLKVLAALVAFFVGRLVIRWIRKIVRRSFERSGADKGVEQFVDSLLKYGLYMKSGNPLLQMVTMQRKTGWGLSQTIIKATRTIMILRVKMWIRSSRKSASSTMRLELYLTMGKR